MAATEDSQATSISDLSLENAFEGAQAVSVFVDRNAFEDALERAQAASVSDSGSENALGVPKPAKGFKSDPGDASQEPQAVSVSDLNLGDASRKSQVASVCDFSQEDTVTLIVGWQEKELVVHGAYLIRDSDYFKAALKKEWTEGQSRTTELPEEEPEIMSHYLAYVYDKELSTKQKSLDEMPEVWDCYNLLASLYVYGEKFLNPSIQQAVIREIFRLLSVRDNGNSKFRPYEQHVNTIYRGTPERSPARRLMVDLYLYQNGKYWVGTGFEPAFLADLAQALYAMCGSLKDDDVVAERGLQPEDYF